MAPSATNIDARLDESARRRGPYSSSERRRAEIVQAAFDVFRSRGFQGGSVREIATAVGVNHSSLNHHFGSKENLLVEVLRRRAASDLPVIRALEEEGGILFASIVMAHLNERNRGIVQLHTVVVAEASNPEHPARVFEQERYANLVEETWAGLRRLDASGALVPDLDLLMEARLLSSVMDGVQIQWLLDSAVDMPAHISRYVDRLHNQPVRRPTQEEVDRFAGAMYPDDHIPHYAAP